MSRQLPLPVNIPDQMTLDTFNVGENQQLLDHLSEQIIGADKQSQISVIVGEMGSGKSHLLFGLCHLTERYDNHAAFVDLAQYRAFSPDILDGLSNADAVCLDNVDAIAGQAAWEIALFNLINSIKLTEHCQLILTSHVGPKHLAFGLPDLVSRLSWGITFQLFTPTEQEKIAILSQRAGARGMALSLELSRYIYTHWQRDMHSLMRSLDELDRLSLEQKRRLTLPFIKQALHI